MTPPTPSSSISIIRVLQEAFTIYRKNLVTFLTISAVVLLPLAFISTLVSTFNAETLNAYQTAFINNPNIAAQLPPEYFTAIFYNLATIMIVALVQITLVNTLITRITAQTRLGQTITGAIETLQQIRPQLPSIFLSHVALFVLAAILSFGLALIAFACGLGFGILIYISIAFSTFLLPIYIIDQVPFKQGISLSWALGKRYIWLIARLTLFNVAIAMFSNVIIGFMQNIFLANVPPTDTLMVVLIIIDTIGAIILAPILPIAATVLYDTILQHNQAINASDLISVEEQSQIFNRQDITNMMIMSVVLLVLFLVMLFSLVSTAG